MISFQNHFSVWVSSLFVFSCEGQYEGHTLLRKDVNRSFTLKDKRVIFLILFLAIDLSPF